MYNLPASWLHFSAPRYYYQKVHKVDGIYSDLYFVSVDLRYRHRRFEIKGNHHYSW